MRLVDGKSLRGDIQDGGFWLNLSNWILAEGIKDETPIVGDEEFDQISRVGESG